MNYQQKYLKYKNKYLILKNLIGGECKKNFMENDEKFLKRGCKVDLLPINDQDKKTNESNKKINTGILNKFKLQDLLLAYDIKELLKIAFTAAEIEEKIKKESMEPKVKFSKIINNGGRIIGFQRDKKNKGALNSSEIIEFKNFWSNLDYSDIIDDYKNFTSNPNNFIKHFDNFDVVQSEYDNIRVKILIEKLNEAKVNEDKDLIAIAFLNSNQNGEHLNLDNDKNKEILNLIYNVTLINIKNEDFEKKFIQYIPNNMNKIFYFSNFENFKEKLTNYNLLEKLKKGIYIPPSILKKIQSAGLL